MKKKIIIIVIAAIIIAVGSYLFYNSLTIACKTTSPNGEYRALYNRITNVIKVEELNSKKYWQIGECENPLLLWSPNSQFLAMTYTNNADGYRTAEIMVVESNTYKPIPVMLDIPTMNEKRANVVVTKWLDNDNVLVEFSYPEGEFAQIISGWFIFEFSNYTIKELTVSE